MVVISGLDNRAASLNSVGNAHQQANLSVFTGQPYAVQDTSRLSAAGPSFEQLLTERIVAMAGGADKIEAYGKAAMAGLDCEQEHASALIHTLHFGNFYREALGAKTYLGFTNTRGPANTQIQIPLMDKHDTGRRSHYLTVQFSIADAPADDELIAAFGGATGGRPHHRIGDRYQDLADIGADVNDPARLGR
jgi:hypothetical protein